MDPIDRIQEILAKAAEWPPDQLQALLDRECAGDAIMRAEVESLVKSLASAGRFLAAPTVAQDTASPHTRHSKPAGTGEGAGSRIGPYKILHLIGEGGFGSVFAAEQEQPVRRKVALKLIKLGMDTGQVVARFEQERQALALMDHANIARVFDAGATESGRPYFVMELVNGEPIVSYCDSNALNIPERLEVFRQVCAAVHHAHTKGVIHRDIKPSNILVGTQDGRPHIKIIDFGIAKATSRPLTDKTLFTELRALIGTPQYMSPEQASGNLDIDTRTDVYSLGVLLYELLTGTTPFSSSELRGAAHAEIQRIIRDVDPPAPSTRLSRSKETLVGAANLRRTPPAKLGALIRGELDWIVMKALEKDRNRRYESANSLESDVRRYLNAEAVVAAPPGRAYLVRKFVLRHKGAVTAVSTVLTALLVGFVAFAWQARIARRERDDAVHARAEERARADELQQVADFQGRMLRQINAAAAGEQLWNDIRERFSSSLERDGIPSASRSARAEFFTNELSKVNSTDVAAAMIDRTILTPSILEIDANFKSQPIVDATLRYSLSVIYDSLGLYDKALPLAESSAATIVRVYGSDHASSITALGFQARLLGATGRGAEGIDIGRLALESAKRFYGMDSDETVTAMANLGNALRNLGRLDEAEPLLRGAMEGRRRMLGNENRSTLASLNTYGFLKIAQGKFAEAEPYWREAYEQGRRIFGPDDPDVLIWTANMGGLLRDIGQFEASATLYREAVDGFRKVRGESHPATLSCLFSLARSLRGAGKTVEAEKVMGELLAAQRRILTDDSPVVAQNLAMLAADRVTLGNMDQARANYEEAIAIYRRIAPDGSAELANTLCLLGKLHLTEHRPADARPILEEAAGMAVKFLPADSPSLPEYQAALAKCLRELE